MFDETWATPQDRPDDTLPSGRDDEVTADLYRRKFIGQHLDRDSRDQVRSLREDRQETAASLPLPFSWNDSVRAADHALEIIVLIDLLGYRQVAADLAHLNREALEDEDIGGPIAAAALRSTAQFLQQNSELRRPALSLSPDGGVVAYWYLAPNKRILLKFDASGLVSFAVVAPSNATETRKRTLNGSGSVKDVSNALRSNGVLRWLANG